MKKFVVDARMLFHSGIGTVLQNMLPGLRQLGWKGEVIVSDEKSSNWCREQLPDWKVIQGASAIYTVAEQFEMARYFNRGTLGWIPHYNAPLLARGRLVVTVQDLLPLAHPEWFGSLPKRIYAQMMFRGVAMRSHTVVFSSQFAAGEMRRFTDCDPAKTRIVPYGVSEAWSAPVSPANDGDYFVYVGNVKPHKNLRRLVEALNLIKQKIPHRLVIVGKKEGFLTGDDGVSAAAARLGSRVEFTGLVEFDRLRQLVAGATALVFPSLYEGYGLPPLEAMAAGCPAICASAASIPEICGSAVQYVDPLSVPDIAEGMLKIVKLSSEQRSLTIEEGRKHVQNFRWETCVQKMDAVLQEAAEGL